MAQARIYATGNRKTRSPASTSRQGPVASRQRPEFESTSRLLALRAVATQPLVLTGKADSRRRRREHRRRRPMSQAESVKFGIAKALQIENPELRTQLKRAGFLTRDAADQGAEKSTASRGRGNGSSSPSGKPRKGRRRPNRAISRREGRGNRLPLLFVRGVKPAGFPAAKPYTMGRMGKRMKRVAIFGRPVHRFRVIRLLLSTRGEALRPHLGAVLRAVPRAGVPSVQGEARRVSFGKMERLLSRSSTSPSSPPAHLVVLCRGGRSCPGDSCDRPVGDFRFRSIPLYESVYGVATRVRPLRKSGLRPSESTGRDPEDTPCRRPAASHLGDPGPVPAPRGRARRPEGDRGGLQDRRFRGGRVHPRFHTRRSRGRPAVRTAEAPHNPEMDQELSIAAGERWRSPSSRT